MAPGMLLSPINLNFITCSKNVWHAISQCLVYWLLEISYVDVLLPFTYKQKLCKLSICLH